MIAYNIFVIFSEIFPVEHDFPINELLCFTCTIHPGINIANDTAAEIEFKYHGEVLNGTLIRNDTKKACLSEPKPSAYKTLTCCSPETTSSDSCRYGLNLHFGSKLTRLQFIF